MSRSYQLLVFDWEGTLGDTLGDILNTIAAEAINQGFGTFDAQLARQCVAFGLATVIQKVFPQLLREQQDQLLHAVHRALTGTPHAVCLMPGARLLLEQLQQAGVMLAVATNKGQQALQRVLQAAHLESLFTVTRSAGQAPAKPCPQMLEEIMQFCGVNASQTLMVGDSVSDIEMATSIGVTAIGVDFDHQQRDQLLAAGASAVFDNYQAFATYLQPHIAN